MAALEDYLFLQPLLEARVKTAVPGLASVGSLSSLDEAAAQQASPAVWILYLGEQVEDSNAGKHVAAQYWSAVLSINYPKEGQAGPLLGALINALSGWVPQATGGQRQSGCEALRRENSRQPVIHDSDWLLFPLVFVARFVWPRKESVWPQS